MNLYYTVAWKRALDLSIQFIKHQKNLIITDKTNQMEVKLGKL